MKNSQAYSICCILQFAFLITAFSNVTAQEIVEADRPSLGIHVHNVDHAESRQLGIRARSGAVTIRVVPDSPAAKAGLQPGDVIVGCNGSVVDNIQNLTTILQGVEAGSKVRLDVHRGREALRLEATFSRETVTSAFGRHQRPPLIGIWATSAGTHDAHELGIETPLGAVLTGIQRDSPASKAGLRAADVIVAFGNREITNYADLECAMLSFPVGSRQAVIFVRGNSRITTNLTIGSGPVERQTYTDYQHTSGRYSLRLPKSWKIVRSTEKPESNVNAHDLIRSRDGNYRLHCYVATKPAANADQTLKEFEQISQRDLGDKAQVSRVSGLPVPMSMAVLPYEADRRVMLYRIAFVNDNQLFVIDSFAPVLSNPTKLTDVLRTILGTIDMEK